VSNTYYIVVVSNTTAVAYSYLYTATPKLAKRGTVETALRALTLFNAHCQG